MVREARSCCRVVVVCSDGTEDGVSKDRGTTAVNHQTVGLIGRKIRDGRCYSIR